MINKTIGFRGTQHFQTHPYDFSYLYLTCVLLCVFFQFLGHIQVGYVVGFSQISGSSSAKDELKQRSSELNYIKEPGPGKSPGNEGVSRGRTCHFYGAFPPCHV